MLDLTVEERIKVEARRDVEREKMMEIASQDIPNFYVLDLIAYRIIPLLIISVGFFRKKCLCRVGRMYWISCRFWSNFSSHVVPGNEVVVYLSVLCVLLFH
ncbi:MAG: hypothetical protein WDO15_00055 [Bacteroidota bacterium]